MSSPARVTPMEDGAMVMLCLLKGRALVLMLVVTKLGNRVKGSIKALFLDQIHQIQNRVNQSMKKTVKNHNGLKQMKLLLSVMWLFLYMSFFY
jgi:hypothetical protein